MHKPPGKKETSSFLLQSHRRNLNQLIFYHFFITVPPLYFSVAFDNDSEFHGFSKIELQRSLAYLQKWDMLMSRHMAPNVPEIKPEFYLKKSHTRFLCTECPKEFTCKSDLWKHAQTKCGQRKRKKCPYCKFKCLNTSKMHKHIRFFHPYQGGVN